MYVITAVRVDAGTTRITHVRWRKMDHATTEWIGEASDVDAHEAASALMRGEQVVSLHSVKGELVFGAKVAYAVHERGNESLETKDPQNFPGRTLLDLPRF